MADATDNEMIYFQAEASSWFKENVRRDPGCLLPETYMYAGTTQQFQVLRS